MTNVAKDGNDMKLGRTSFSVFSTTFVVFRYLESLAFPFYIPLLLSSTSQA